MRWLLAILILAWSVVASAQECGNGTTEQGEECDDGNENSDTLQNHCRSNCTLPRCGDAVVDVSETCDDGNTSDGDVCSSDCKDSWEAKPSWYKENPGEIASEKPPLDPDIALQRAVLFTFYGPPGLGVLYGPSMGHFYAGETDRAIGMTLARTLVVGANIGASIALVNGKLSLNAFKVLSIASSLTLSGLVAADIIDAPKAARRANEKKKSDAR